ncbi:MAG: FxDxF family PEP-CTERM protein, partial [Janthinobacterium sp.]
TVGLSTYFGYGAATAQSASNQYGNYSTFTGTFASPVAAVPEPETYAMMLAGLGLVGFMARRRKAGKHTA